MTTATLATVQEDYHLKDVDYFSPDETVITALRRAISNGQDLLLQREGRGELLLLGSRAEYFSRLEDEAAFFSTPVEKISITILGSGDRRIPEVGRAGRDVAELLWKAAYHASEGRLLHGCYPADMVEIAHWPNLTRLPHTPNTPRILALLSRHPAPVAFVARLLRIPPKELYCFYSAARCAGIARPINRKFEEPRLEPHRNQTLLKTLLQKISSL